MTNQISPFGIVGVLIIIMAGVGGFFYLISTNVTPTPAPSPNVTINLYAGEVSFTQYGFGNSSSTITSPGPPFNVQVNDTVKINFYNVGAMPHAFAVVDVLGNNYNVLFNSAIASGATPLSPGGSGTVTFTCTQAGSYYYICTVPGHVALGMWGNFTVS